MLNLILAAWIIASPWIYSYTSETSRFVNSVCIGVLILILAGFRSFDPIEAKSVIDCCSGLLSPSDAMGPRHFRPSASVVC